MHILIVEDDPVLRRSISQGLREQGYDCTAVRDGEKALGALEAKPADLVLMDHMLPGMSGLDVLREMRERGVQTPVVMLTARGTTEDRITGLRAGADDYIVKPFDFGEVIARVEAVGRRSLNRPQAALSVGDVTLDLSTRRVTRGDREVDLTPTECSVLEMLMRFSGQTVTRTMLCQHVWGFVWDGNTNVIEVHINRLRHKLDTLCDKPIIHTVRGRGYVARPS